jgi:hypothetical protein
MKHRGMFQLDTLINKVNVTLTILYRNRELEMGVPKFYHSLHQQ